MFPRCAEEVAEIVRSRTATKCRSSDAAPARGLSGGVDRTRAGGVMIAFARMNRILEIDLVMSARSCEPGVVNLDITLAVQGSSTSMRRTLRASAPARSAVTSRRTPADRIRLPTASQRIMFWAWRVVLPDGTVIIPAGKELDLPGYDLTGLFTGSEGTMALSRRSSFA